MPQVYTARVRVRHDELDAVGHLHAAAYLRYLAQTAIEAAAAAGFDTAWHAAAGGQWLIRRSTIEVLAPAREGEELEVRTWLEDVRRVRCHRRYELRDEDDRLRLTALSDWVYVDATSGRPRRVPAEVMAHFGLPVAPGSERAPWSAPPPPPRPARAEHRVRWADLDSLGHMNNAAYLDVVGQATLDVLADVGWGLDRLLAAGAVPALAGADLEYREAARYGDRLETLTWFAPATGTLDVHQHVTRADAPGPLVRASTRWRWVDPASGEVTEAPPDLAVALRPLLAA